MYDYVPSLSQHLSTDQLLKNDNVSQLGMVKNTTTPLYSETTKPEKIFDKEKTTDDVKIKKTKNKNNLTLIKVMQTFNPELQLKSTESAIKNKLKNLLTELRGLKYLFRLRTRKKYLQKRY